MFLLAAPIVVLYFIAVGISEWHDRGVARRMADITSDASTPASV